MSPAPGRSGLTLHGNQPGQFAARRQRIGTGPEQVVENVVRVKSPIRSHVPPPSAPGMPPAAAASSPQATGGGGSWDLSRFMAAIAGKESNNNPNARNARTGAYGTFQIMPGNWPSWSREAGVSGPPTPQSQNQVAQYKMNQYFNHWVSKGQSPDMAMRLTAAQWYGGMGGARKYLAGGGGKRFRANEPSIREYVNAIAKRYG